MYGNLKYVLQLEYLEETYLALKEKGRIMCSILSYKAYQNSHSVEYGELNAMSPLRQWGYTVSQEEGYTDKQRQMILEDILDYNVMTKDKLLSYLNFFIRLNQHKKDSALGKWMDDRKYVEQYKLGTAKRIKVDRIIVIERR